MKLKIRMPMSKRTASLVLGLVGLVVVAVVVVSASCAGSVTGREPDIGQLFSTDDGCQVCWYEGDGHWVCDPVDIYDPDCEGGEWE